MIKNITLLLALASLAGCTAARAGTPGRFQGIVAHDDVVLAFEVGGRVAELSVDRGSPVTAEAPVARLDDGLERPLRDVRAAEVELAGAQLRLVQAGPRSEEIRSARAELEAVRAQTEVAERGLERQLSLAGQGASAAARRDDLDAQLAALRGRREGLEQRLLALRRGSRAEELDAAEARVTQSTAALAATEARLARFALRAPIAGTVVDRHVSVGEVIAPGAPVVTVSDLAHPYVDVFVPEGSMRAVRIGMRARVTVDGVEDALVGRVEFVSDRTEFTPRFLFSDGERPNLVLRVRVRIEDPHHVLHAGVPAFATLEGLR